MVKVKKEVFSESLLAELVAYVLYIFYIIGLGYTYLF